MFLLQNSKVGAELIGVKEVMAPCAALCLLFLPSRKPYPCSLGDSLVSFPRQPPFSQPQFQLRNLGEVTDLHQHLHNFLSYPCCMNTMSAQLFLPWKLKAGQCLPGSLPDEPSSVTDSQEAFQRCSAFMWVLGTCPLHNSNCSFYWATSPAPIFILPNAF